MRDYLRYGVSFPLQGAFGFGAVLKLAKFAEDVGFSSVWVGDHFFAPARTYAQVGGDGDEPDKLDAWTVLASIASRTEKVTVGTAVSPIPLYNPGKLAKIAVTVHLISKGRAVIGVGAGWFREEAVAYGVPWLPLDERREQLREGIEVIRSLLNDASTTYKGKYYHLKKAPFFPKPEVSLPIYVGGSSDSILNTVGELGDGWLAVGLRSADHFASSVSKAKAAAFRHGRDPQTIAMVPFLPYPDNLGKNGAVWKRTAREYYQEGARHIIVTTAESRTPKKCAGFLKDFSKKIISNPS